MLIKLKIVLLATLLLGVVSSSAQANSISYIHTPKSHVKVKRHFTPWAHPNPNGVVKIINWEQKKWGGPSLYNRAHCETHFIWNANKGMAYHGVLALGRVAWNMLWPGTPRNVRLVRHKTRFAPVYRVTVWDSGRKHKKHISSVKQHMKIVKAGKLPKNPNAFHVWASVRAVQRYVAGITHPGYISWSCPL